VWNLLKYVWIYREKFLILALIGVSIVSLYLPKETGFFIYRRFNRSIIAPFQIVLDQIEMYKNAVKRSEELGEENIRLTLALHSMKMIEEENLRLRDLLDFSTDRGVRFEAARVISYNLSGPLNSIMVDKGKEDGIKPLLPVLTPEGLVGKIVEVDRNLSMVELYSSIGFSVSGMVVECGEVGIVTTRGAGKLFLEGLNLRTEVSVGNRIVSSGLGRVFPVGIPVGTVESIELDPLGVHKVASIMPEVRLNRVREVFILSDSTFVKADPLWLTWTKGSLSALWEDFTYDSLEVGLENYETDTISVSSE
jgi:rod shape-determining protein MreC